MRGDRRSRTDFLDRSNGFGLFAFGIGIGFGFLVFGIGVGVGVGFGFRLGKRFRRGVDCI